MFTFVQTGTPLAEGATYSVTIRSGANAFHSLDGRALDGDDNGIAGGDYTTTFTAPTLPAGTVSVLAGDFAEGPGQSFNIPYAFDGDVNDTAEMDVLYNPTLLTIDPIDPSIDPGVSLTITPTTSPYVSIAHISVDTDEIVMGDTALDGTGLPIVTGSVPLTAPYGSKQVIQFENVVLDGVPGGGVSGVEVVGYQGAVDGGFYKTAQDATLIAQVAVGLGAVGTDTPAGFAAFQNADPAILADINGGGISTPRTPRWRPSGRPTCRRPASPISPPPPIRCMGGPDPRLYLPQITAAPGQTVTVALRMEAVESFNLTSADIAFQFDASKFQISNVRLSSSLNGFAVAPNIDNVNGTLKASIFTGSLGQSFVQGQDIPLLLFDVTVAKNAPAGATPLNLAQQVGDVRTDLNGGALTLNPGPTTARSTPAWTAR